MNFTQIAFEIKVDVTADERFSNKINGLKNYNFLFPVTDIDTRIWAI